MKECKDICSARAAEAEIINKEKKVSANFVSFVLTISIITLKTDIVAKVTYFVVIVPMRWLADNTHKLLHQNWGEQTMRRAIDMLHLSFMEIQD